MTEAIPKMLLAASAAALACQIGPLAVLLAPALILITTTVAQAVCDAIEKGEQ